MILGLKEKMLCPQVAFQRADCSFKESAVNWTWHLYKLQHQNAEDGKHQNPLNTVEHPGAGLSSLDQAGSSKS